MTQERVIHLVDDEDAVRRSAGFLLRTSGYKVYTYVSGVEFLAGVKRAEPGCILLDVRMPVMDGLEVQAELNDRGVVMPVIVLTGHGDINTAVIAMKAGASDFIEKPFEMDVLTQAIEMAFVRLEQGVAGNSHRHDAQVRIAALSPRERDVLLGLVAGRPNKVIAHDLDISPRTVEVYRAGLMSKLGVRSLSEALRIAFAAGMTGDIGPVSLQAGDTT
jgi:two-component system response regulator FixJ